VNIFKRNEINKSNIQQGYDITNYTNHKNYNVFYWLSGFSFLFSIIALCGAYVYKNIVIVNESIMLIFVGVLATFIVVGNYAQVKDIERKFDDIKSKIHDLKIDDYIKIGNPVLLESYSLNASAKTSIILQYSQENNKEHILLNMANMVIIKGKLIEISGYFIYEGKESITQAKAKNDYFVLRFMDENK